MRSVCISKAMHKLYRAEQLYEFRWAKHKIERKVGRVYELRMKRA
jgi:hypothetical protein